MSHDSSSEGTPKILLPLRNHLIPTRITPLRLVAVALADWLSQRQQDGIEYLPVAATQRPAARQPFLVFDWKRNYRDLLALPGYEDIAVYTVGRSIAPLSFNPLIPPPETPPRTWLKKLISVVLLLLGLGLFVFGAWSAVAARTMALSVSG